MQAAREDFSVPLRLFSPVAVRLDALRALFPQALPPESAKPSILLIDAVEATPWPGMASGPAFLLAPTRPADLPPGMHWLATPLGAATLRQHLVRAWAERPREMAGHRLLQQPASWQPPGGAPIPLSEKEAQLLARLMDRPEGLPREILLEELWGMDGARVETHALETQLYRLRQKLLPGWGEDWFIGLRNGICLLEPPQPAAADG